MAILSFICAFFWTLCLHIVAADSDVSVRTVNAPGRSDEHTYLAIRRGLVSAQLEKREGQEFKVNTTLDTSWNGAVLLKFGASAEVGENQNNDSTTNVNAGVEIVCTECYIKGLATAELTVGDSFNISTALEQTADEVGDSIRNFTNEVEDYFDDYFSNLTTKFDDGIDPSDFAFPTFNYSFDMDVPTIPEVNLKFQFDGMELYMQLNTILNLGATYELNLYKSNTPVGVAVGKNLEFGIIFGVDLILAVEGEIDISSGFHLQLDDEVEINIALFGKDISDIIFNGGRFEFLPVTLESAGVKFSAILRIGAHAGLTIVTPEIPEITVFNHSLTPQFGGGIEVGVFANVAEFVTNVTYVPDDEDCKLQIVQEYSLALGAAAGATININSETYGPVAEIQTPIWYTTMAEACAIEGKPSPTTTPLVTATGDVQRRQDLTTTVISTEIKHTGVNCKSQLVNCPASLQETTQSVETRTLTTAVPSGEDAKFPETVHLNTVATTVAFGKDAQSIDKISGSPKSYVPPPPTSKPGEDGEDGSKGALGGEVGGVSKKVIVGVSVGLGVPVLAAIIGAIVFITKRKRYSPVPRNEGPTMVAEPYDPQSYSDHVAKPAKTGISVTEVRH